MSATSPRSSIDPRQAPGCARALLLGLLVVVSLPPAAQASAGDPGAGSEVGRQARAVLSDPRFQRGVEAPQAAASPRQERERDAGWELPEEPPVPSAVPSPGGARFIFLVFGGLALGLALVGLVVTRAAPLATPPSPGADGAEGGEASPAGEAQAVAGDPDLLAAQGRYGEALHALLLAAIAGLAQRCLHPPPPSRTSRELIRQLPLRPEAREAFAGLVAAVELHLFGGVAAGEEDYRRNLARFQLIAGRTG